MSDQCASSRTILIRVLVGAFIGAMLGYTTWAIAFFLGMQVSATQVSATNAPAPFLSDLLLDIAFAPNNRFLIVFSSFGTLFGILAGAFVSGGLEKARQARQTRRSSSSEDAWPPPPTL